jgi:hypothetical protein
MNELDKVHLAKVAYEASCDDENQLLTPTLFENLSTDEVIKWVKVLEAIAKALPDLNK